MNIKRIAWVLSALFAMIVIAACTTERAAVDKTDELALDKKLFDGEFFYRQTVVELPYTADYAFIGESNDGKIVKWKITQNWLIAYSIHDAINIVDSAEQMSANETPILAYAILDHFDILPQENPTTGEAMPMLVPNHDRPWNERRYFIIDQSNNAIVNAELKYLWMTQEWDNPFYTSVVTAATDVEFYAHDGSYIPPKKYAEMIADAGDAAIDKEVELFTYRSEEYLVSYNNWNSIYTMEDVQEFINTEPARIVKKHTFKKVNRNVVGKRHYDPSTQQFTWKSGDKDSGFRPLEFRDELFREFGYFTNLFRGYDPEAGYKDKDYHELANYFNIAWAKAGDTAGTAKDWNFACAAGQGVPSKYNTCLADLKYQQKMVFTSSSETPLRMLPANCAITKDYNHAMLAARFAAMNPDSDTRDFEAWYVANYKNDFFKTVKGKTVRNDEWYLNAPEGWEDKCFFSNDAAFVQKWDGTFVADEYINEIVVMVKNPVEGYIANRDGKHRSDATGYDRYKGENNENAVFICVTQAEADKAVEGKRNYFENCFTNEAEMKELYEEQYGRAEWMGDRYDCKILKTDETCPAGYVEVKAACELTDSRTCKFYDNGEGLPKLRHKYTNGGLDVALINWVDQPTEYGILGVSQWNVNPETGQSLGAGSNIAGSVLEWVMNRTVELSRILIDEEDPAAWDWEDIINPPDYSNRPSVVFQNNPEKMKPRFAKTTMPAITRNELLDPALKLEQQGEKVKGLLEKIAASQHTYNRFDYSKLKGTKWETEMVPYSMRTAMLPWATEDWNYSDGEKGILGRFVSGPEAFNIEMLKYLEGMKLDFYMDETFLDGAIILFLKGKMEDLRAKYPNYKTSQKEAYVKEFTSAIFYELEPLTYKGVAQHEMGHSVGLRHNFSGSADQMNYQDRYFATENYPAMMAEVKTKVQEMYDAGQDPATMGEDVYNVKRSFEAKMNYYTYTSVMDYQREAYIHGVGLGKYDYAALKFVYGRAVEQYKTDNDGFVAMDTTNPLRDANYSFPVLINKPFIDNATGELIKLTEPKQVITYVDPDPSIGKTMRMVSAVKRDMLGFPIIDKDNEVYKPVDTEYFVNDGSIHKYIFFSDERQTDEPINKVFDGGYSGADSVRFMANTEQSYYFTRFFKRGNPKFREFRGRTWYKMILDTLLDKYKYVHYLLDLNYNAIRGGWFSHVIQLWSSETGCGEQEYMLGWGLDAEKIAVPDVYCTDYLRAMRGVEYWIDENGDLQTLTPFGPGDYLVAGGIGINYFVSDVLYRPDAGEYLKLGPDDAALDEKVEVGQEGYWVPNPYVIDGETIENGAVNVGISPDDLMIVSPVFGRYHRDRYDIQEDSSIYYDKVIRRGFSEEKAVAIYALSNQGWFSGKYQRESMANGLGQQAPGVDNLIFAMFGDIANEDSILSFAPYCVKQGGNEIIKMNIPVNTYYRFNGEAPFYAPSTAPEDAGNPWKEALAQDLPKNLCAGAVDSEDPGAIFEPVHAGWVYFDKLSPLYWGIGNVMNASADTSVLLKFGSFTYGTYRTDVRPTDIDEIEVINSVGNMYYRAKLPQSDLSAIDLADLSWWKQRKAAGATDAEALCDWATAPEFDQAGALITIKACATDGGGDFVLKYATKEAFKAYLEDTYARYSPAYRLVRTLSKLSGQSAGGAVQSDPSNYKVSVIETTLDQMNTFVADQFGTALMYAYFI